MSGRTEFLLKCCICGQRERGTFSLVLKKHVCFFCQAEGLMDVAEEDEVTETNNDPAWKAVK